MVEIGRGFQPLPISTIPLAVGPRAGQDEQEDDVYIALKALVGLVDGPILQLLLVRCLRRRQERERSGEEKEME